MLLPLNYLVMIISFNYLAVINSGGELIWGSHGAARDSDSLGFAVKDFADKPGSLCSLQELFDVNSALFSSHPTFLQGRAEGIVQRA